MKKALLALAVAGAAVSVHADTSVSGFVNFALGDTTETRANASAPEQDFRVSRATTSGSRFRIVSTKKAGDVTWGVKQEFSVDSASDAAKDDITIRNNELWVTGDFGKVSLGQGSEVGDGFTENDYSGTYLLNGNNGLFGAGVDAADGNRTERLRYDSPKLGGIFTVSASYTGNETNVGAQAKGANYDIEVFKIGRQAATGDVVGGSAAAIFGGVTLAYQFSEIDNGSAADTEADAFIIGYKTGAFSFAVDVAEDGTNKDHTGVSFVYRPAKGIELYTGFRTVETGSTDADAYALGARVQF
jgi:hypothetical protein